jgi:hypothetical protein
LRSFWGDDHLLLTTLAGILHAFMTNDFKVPRDVLQLLARIGREFLTNLTTAWATTIRFVQLVPLNFSRKVCRERAATCGIPLR